MRWMLGILAGLVAATALACGSGGGGGTPNTPTPIQSARPAQTPYVFQGAVLCDSADSMETDAFPSLPVQVFCKWKCVDFGGGPIMRSYLFKLNAPGDWNPPTITEGTCE